jgi:ankyrin repeat protein
MKSLIVSLLLAGAAYADDTGWTALHTAASDGDTRAVEKLAARHPEYVNAFEGGQHTPLHVAVFDRQTKAAACLIDHGANVNAPDVCGWTPLHTAANRGELPAAELLVANGADINLKDKKGQTPLRLAEKYKHVELAEWLRRQGAKE